MKALRQSLLDQLTVALEPLGFRRSQQSFWREFPGGRDAFHIAFIPHRTDFDLTADVAVRYDSIEEQLNALRPHLSARDKRQTATIGAELGNLLGVGQRRWTVTCEEDVPAVVLGVLAAFREIGDPFLLRFHSLDELRQVLTHEPAFARLVCPIPDTRARVIALLRPPTTHVA